MDDDGMDRGGYRKEPVEQLVENRAEPCYYRG